MHPITEVDINRSRAPVQKFRALCPAPMRMTGGVLLPAVRLCLRNAEHTRAAVGQGMRDQLPDQFRRHFQSVALEKGSVQLPGDVFFSGCSMVLLQNCDLRRYTRYDFRRRQRAVYDKVGVRPYGAQHFKKGGPRMFEILPKFRADRVPVRRCMVAQDAARQGDVQRCIQKTARSINGAINAFR